MDRYLFLFGGNPSLLDANRYFVSKAGGQHAKIALLIMNTSRWEQFVPAYTEIWREIGISHHSIIIPDENSVIDPASTESILEDATAIFIGGGDTYLYLQHYNASPLRELIIKRYFEGVPVAGCSAGALTVMEKGYISPEESRTDEIDYFDGLGLLKDAVIGVHFTEENQQYHLKTAMKNYEIEKGYGIDEEACAVFLNETYHRAFGNEVHIIKSNLSPLGNNHLKRDL